MNYILCIIHYHCKFWFWDIFWLFTVYLRFLVDLGMLCVNLSLINVQCNGYVGWLCAKNKWLSFFKWEIQLMWIFMSIIRIVHPFRGSNLWRFELWRSYSFHAAFSECYLKMFCRIQNREENEKRVLQD